MLLRRNGGRRKKTEPLPHMSAIVPYVRSANTDTVILSTIISRITKGQAPFPRKKIAR